MRQNKNMVIGRNMRRRLTVSDGSLCSWCYYHDINTIPSETAKKWVEEHGDIPDSVLSHVPREERYKLKERLYNKWGVDHQRLSPAA